MYRLHLHANDKRFQFSSNCRKYCSYICLSRYVKVTSDIIVAKFNNNTIYSYPNGNEATFLDILNDLRDEL